MEPDAAVNAGDTQSRTENQLGCACGCPGPCVQLHTTLCPFDVASAPDTSDSGGQSRDGTQPRPEGLPSTGGGTEDGRSCDSARAGSPSQSEYEGDDYSDDSTNVDHGQRRRGRLLLPRFRRKGQPVTPPLEGPGTSTSTRDDDSASEEGLPRRRPQQRRRPPQRFGVWK